MKRTTILGIAVAVVIGLPLAGSSRADATGPMPTFSLKRVDGASYDSKRELAGKPAVVWFMRFDQPASTNVLNEMTTAYREYKAAGVQMVAIVSGTIEPKALKGLKALKTPVTILLDPERVAYGAFGVFVYPWMEFVDAKGRRRFHYSGHRRDFGIVVRANLDFLLGRLSLAQHKKRTTPANAAPTSGTLKGGKMYYRMAQKLIKGGKRREAKAPLRQAWESKPPHAAAGADLALLLLEEGDPKAALDLLEKVQKAAPDSPRVLAAKAVSMIEAARDSKSKSKGLQKKGEKLLREVLSANELDEPLFYYEFGLLCESTGDKDGAIRHYKRATELVLAEQRSR